MIKMKSDLLYSRNNHPRWLRPLLWLLIAVILIAVPADMQAAKKKRTTKPKTTATTKKRATTTKKGTTSTKKRRTSSRRRTSAVKTSGGSNWALTAADVNPDSKGPASKPKK